MTTFRAMNNIFLKNLSMVLINEKCVMIWRVESWLIWIFCSDVSLRRIKDYVYRMYNGRRGDGKSVYANYFEILSGELTKMQWMREYKIIAMSLLELWILNRDFYISNVRCHVCQQIQNLFFSPQKPDRTECTHHYGDGVVWWRFFNKVLLVCGLINFLYVHNTFEF